jgi:type IV pilus assembly protein PilN
MILINLLPHREAARKKRKERFFVHLAMAAALGGALSALIFTVVQQRLSVQEDRNALLGSEVAKLDGQIKDIATLETDIAALRARQGAVENLQSDRNLPVHLLQEMVRQLPEGVVLRTLKQEGQAVQLTGSAQSQERVSEFLRNLSTQSPALAQPELLEIVANSQGPTARDQRRVFNFSIKVQLQRAKSGPAEPAPSTQQTS